MAHVEEEIGAWRAFVQQRPGVDDRDADELEAHLRDQMADLDAAGLTPDEAFLIAVKRIGALDDVSQEFAREHSGRLWKQLVLSGGDAERGDEARWQEALVFALGAAVTVQLARLVAGFSGEQSPWLLRNASLLVLPYLAGYFARLRGLTARRCVLTAIPAVVAAVLVNLYPFDDGATTGVLVAAHLPVVLWFLVAAAYTGGESAPTNGAWTSSASRASGSSTTCCSPWAVVCSWGSPRGSSSPPAWTPSG